MFSFLDMDSLCYLLLGLLFEWQARAKHDLTNTAIAGCITGGAISVKGIPYFLALLY